ncbi:MAG TPA: MFS transporter [Gammaproteobacteria bacterium]|nr:MFS transporter [Gammaproteobacteria bacterium]
MTTLVMVEKAGVACMAADTLGSFGMRKESAHYVARPEKIIEVDGSYIGLVGWGAHREVLESVFANGLKLPEIATERDLFEFSRKLHKKLKKDYFLRTTEDPDDPYESSQMMLFILNRNGMFRLCSLRSADRCRRFAAAGSGTPFALGAMHSAYEQGLPAEEIARAGVKAGIEFDRASNGPITLKRLEIKRESVLSPGLEALTV